MQSSVLSIVTAKAVSFELPNGRELFSDFSFSLSNQLTALVGPNGVGKTTLARILSGELEPSTGAVKRNAEVVFLPQRADPPAISVSDYLGSDYEFGAASEQMLAPVDRSALCSQLSGGQWMRVRLARMINDSFLILDEPTNDLDREGREAVLEFLKRHRGGALIISHDRECLAICDAVLELSNQGLSKFGGTWAEYEEHKALERANLGHALELAKREHAETLAQGRANVEQQEKRNRRGAQQAKKGGLPKILSGARKRQAQTTSGKISATTLEKSKAAVQEIYGAYSQIKTDPVMFADLLSPEIPAQKLVAEVSGFNIRLNDRWLYSADLNFSWRGNIRLAIQGANGSGKTTLLNALLGSDFETRGVLRRGDLRALYLDQRCANLADDLSVLENVRLNSALPESEIRNGLSKFLFSGDSIFQKVADLSGGERLRAALAASFLSEDKPELLVLDEPTNNLDLGNVEFLETMLKEFSGAVLAISHDPVFLTHAKITEFFEL